jgi:ATP-dependent DNA ligase
LNSSVNCRRTRRAGLLLAMRDIVSTFRNVSTESDQAQKDCRWLKPALGAQIEFLEWTGENHLRHTKFVTLCDDKPAHEVRRE